MRARSLAPLVKARSFGMTRQINEYFCHCSTNYQSQSAAITAEVSNDSARMACNTIWPSA